ncbi:trifunctional serine/threonine-protein kinase/ATP-binding protein/sensor histidine kinase [Roseofilum casamattae]|uniref:histidine kinase n=1 Tax=Roseofilum casamattae BLCC-M143 TaxID=3022442 RepID=A0ABT7C347_9CYAN|nr:AAA family ATPase [Roseofilum casamattae]MDJ1184958.1 AAA family ATPase [Roseofilum casamattae BLCC-M143]
MLGERDLCDRFLLPEKLYGREPEVRQLLAAFERVAEESGTSQLFLVAGYSGVGKTTVVNEVHKPIVKNRGYFIKGKFDQFQRNIPFSAFVQAFRDLMGQLLGDRDSQLQQWKAKILLVLGENAQVIIDTIPELEAILGEQPPVPELEGHAAQQRFNLLFQKFIRVFATVEHPLTIFLDDLQWADSGSLQLMELLLEESEKSCLLLIGAYRDNEVSLAHPLMAALNRITAQGTNIETITLAPLTSTDLNDLISNTLKCSLERSQPLTDLVFQNTQGNPFFSTQLLKALHDDGWITLNWESRSWQCNLDKVREHFINDNVVDFTISRLQKLTVETQDSLKLASCIGSSFSLSTLAIVREKSLAETGADLWDALREGLVVPQNETYKFYQDREITNDPLLDRDLNADFATQLPSYKFLHDRVQQAAYALIPEDRKPSIHYRIGGLLLESLSPEERGDRIFEIVSHLNNGATLIAEQHKRDELARFNLTAGQKAKGGTAYESARNHAEIAIELLGKEAWQREYTLTLQLHELAAEMAAIARDSEAMNGWIDAAISQSKTFLDKLGSYICRMQFLTGNNQFAEAVESGQFILQKLGVEFPNAVTPVELQQEIDDIQTLMGDRAIEDILNLPAMSHPESLAIMKIAARMIPAAYLSNSPLFPLLGSLQTKLSLQSGNAPTSSTGYADYGVFLLHFKRDIATSNQFGQLAYQLAARAQDKNIPAITFVPVGLFLYHNQYHLRETLPIFQAGYQAALDVGRVEYLGHHAQGFCVASFWSGCSLPELLVQVRAYLDVMVKFNLLVSQNYCSIILEIVLALLGNPDEILLELSETDDRSTRLAELLESRDATGVFYFYLHRAILRFFLGDLERAATDTIAAKEWIGGGTGMACEVGFYFYDSLIALGSIGESAGDREAAIAKVEENQEYIRWRSDFTPMNYLHKWQLVEAEKYRVLGQKYEAGDWYDRAIAGAKANEYIQEESLANELAAKFYLDWGKDKIASGYMQEAYYGYAHWGAKAKTDDLEQRYPQLLSSILAPPVAIAKPHATISTERTSTVLSTSISVSDRLDFSSLLKACRTLSQEIERDRAISHLMHVIQENAGAETVALILFRDETLILEAKHTDGRTELIECALDDDSQAVPLAIVNTVKRTQTSLLLDNAADDNTYSRDDYIQAHQSRSVLCVPLLDRGRSIGIIYLENNQVAGAFATDRIEMVELLCAQAAITLENARLYQQAQQALQLERELHDLQRTQLTLIHSEKMFSLGQMVGGIAHEINNPISFIYGNIDYAKDYARHLIQAIELYQNRVADTHPDLAEIVAEMDLDYCKEDFPQLLDSMSTGVKRIQTIIAALRNFSRLDEAELKAVDLHEGLESTLTILQPRLYGPEGAIAIVKNYGDLPLIECYASQLNQVFMNILNNAIDALEDSPGIHPQISICTEANEKTVTISISDNGKGISTEAQTRLFDPFFTTKTVGKGTGLGLSIAYQIITEQHEGNLSFQSQPGETIFAIAIPLHQNP